MPACLRLFFLSFLCVESVAQQLEWIGGLGAVNPNQHLPLTNIFNLYYVGTVSIGSPPRLFTLLFDTGSTLSWLRGRDCRIRRLDGRSCSGAGHEFFEPQRSWTARPMVKHFHVLYDDGGRTMGAIYSDTVVIGHPLNSSLKQANVEFGVATVINEETDARPYDGIFALGFGRPDEAANFVQRAAWGQMRLPLFSVHLGAASRTFNAIRPADGQITFGGVDLRRCASWAVFTPLLNGRDWRFRTGAVWANGVAVASSAVVSSDTGTSTILVPAFAFRRLAAVFGVARADGRLDAVPAVDCERNFSLRVQIGAQTLLLTERHLVTRYDLPGGEKCNLQIAPSATDLWVFGTPVIRSFCHIYDLGRRQLGFAATIA
ncbi:Eukaryotic aspartyl protease [Aphelenchoides fujianensis]|nr:Eukaryotic aspartyl protease [Aphelenchoides fujianensis]